MTYGNICLSLYATSAKLISDSDLCVPPTPLPRLGWNEQHLQMEWATYVPTARIISKLLALPTEKQVTQLQQLKQRSWKQSKYYKKIQSTEESSCFHHSNRTSEGSFSASAGENECKQKWISLLSL